MSSDLKRLKAALNMAAILCREDPIYTPIFRRIEEEIKLYNDQVDLNKRIEAIACAYKAVA